MIDAVQFIKKCENAFKYPWRIRCGWMIQYVPCELVQQNKLKISVREFGGYESGHPGEYIEIAESDIIQLHMGRGKSQLAHEIMAIANDGTTEKKKRLDKIQKLLAEFVPR